MTSRNLSIISAFVALLASTFSLHAQTGLTAETWNNLTQGDSVIILQQEVQTPLGCKFNQARNLSLLAAIHVIQATVLLKFKAIIVRHIMDVYIIMGHWISYLVQQVI